ncbi:MAG: hypothetical protein LBJ46_09345 [Planctomycetota bacterium]|nr:hypothetical protein [Planctomycetota bacterium]
MTTLVEEEVIAQEGVQIVFGSAIATSRAYLLNRDAVGFANHEAASVETEALAAFLDPIYGADPDYIETPAPNLAENPVMNWDEVGATLAESQAMLRTMQEFIIVILSEHGIENPECVRIYEDEAGGLRMVGDHERRDDIEAILNAPENRQLKELYRAVTAGMSLAGSLIGSGALPKEVRKNVLSGAPAA